MSNTTINNFERNSNQSTAVSRNLNKSNTTNTNFEILRNENNNNANVSFRLGFTEPLFGNHYLKTEGSARILSGTEKTNQSRKTTKTMFVFQSSFKHICHNTTFPSILCVCPDVHQPNNMSILEFGRQEIFRF